MTGNGSKSNPYIIETLANLQSMKDALDKYYKLGNNIDASATSTWNEDPLNLGTYFGFEPIGKIWYDEGNSKYVEEPFTGGLDGSIYRIENLYINRPTELGVGLFGLTSGDDIKEVGVIDCNIIGLDFVGGLIGANLKSPVLRSYVIGDVIGNDYVGGLVGISTKDPLDIPNGAETGEVKTTANSYARGNVTGNQYVGGLFGASIGDYVYRCFSTSAVSGNLDMGGLIGYSDEGTVLDSFWDRDTSGLETSAGGTGRTTRQMTRISTYYAWNIQMTRAYRLNEGYPFLYWQTKK